MIVDEIAIDSEKGDNISELRAMIAKHAVMLRFMGDPFPQTWQKTRQAVAALNPPNKPKKTAAHRHTTASNPFAKKTTLPTKTRCSRWRPCSCTISAGLPITGIATA